MPSTNENNTLASILELEHELPQSEVQPVERQIIIHSAHPYHFILMDGPEAGKWAGWDGLARALAEDYEDISKLRGLVRRLCHEHSDDAALHTEATTLKCFE